MVGRAVSGGRRDHAMNAVASLFVPLASILTAPLLARALGPAGRGEFTVEQSLVLVASSLFGLGISDDVATRWTSYRARHRVRVTVTNVVASLVFAVVGSAYLMMWSSPGVVEILLCVIAAPVFALALQERGVALALGDVRGVAVEKIVTVLSRLASTGVLFVAGTLDVRSALLTLVAPQLLGLLYLVRRRTKRVRGAGGPRSASAAPAEGGGGSSDGVLAGLWWTVLGGTGGVFLVNGVPLLAIAAIGATEVGYFSVCILIAEVFTLAAKPFRDASFTSPYKEEPRAMSRLNRLGLVALTGLGAVGAGVVWWAVPAVFGHDFAPAVPAAYVMLLGGILKGWGYQLNGALTVGGRHRVRASSTYAAVVINVVLLFVFAPAGVLGAAAASAAAYGLMALWSATALAGGRRPGVRA